MSRSPKQQCQKVSPLYPWIELKHCQDSGAICFKSEIPKGMVFHLQSYIVFWSQRLVPKWQRFCSWCRLQLSVSSAGEIWFGEYGALKKYAEIVPASSCRCHPRFSRSYWKATRSINEEHKKEFYRRIIMCSSEDDVCSYKKKLCYELLKGSALCRRFSFIRSVEHIAYN